MDSSHSGEGGGGPREGAMWRRAPKRGAQRREPPRPRSAYALSQRRAETRAVLAHDANLLRAALREGGGGGAKTSGGTRMAQTGEHTRRRKSIAPRSSASARVMPAARPAVPLVKSNAAAALEQLPQSASRLLPARQAASSLRAGVPASRGRRRINGGGHLRAQLQMQPTKQAKVGAREASSAVGGLTHRHFRSRGESAARR